MARFVRESMKRNRVQTATIRHVYAACRRQDSGPLAYFAAVQFAIAGEHFSLEIPAEVVEEMYEKLMQAKKDFAHEETQ